MVFLLHGALLGFFVLIIVELYKLRIFWSHIIIKDRYSKYIKKFRTYAIALFVTTLLTAGTAHWITLLQGTKVAENFIWFKFIHLFLAAGFFTYSALLALFSYTAKGFDEKINKICLNFTSWFGIATILTGFVLLFL